MSQPIRCSIPVAPFVAMCQGRGDPPHPEHGCCNVGDHRHLVYSYVMQKYGVNSEVLVESRKIYCSRCCPSDACKARREEEKRSRDSAITEQPHAA